MPDPINKNQQCIKLLSPYPWLNNSRKSGYIDALRDYQFEFLKAKNDAEKLKSVEKILNYQRVAHWNRAFSEYHNAAEHDYSHGYVMGLSAVRITGIHTQEDNSRNDFYSLCLEKLRKGIITFSKSEELKNPY